MDFTHRSDPQPILVPGILKGFVGFASGGVVGVGRDLRSPGTLVQHDIILAIEHETKAFNLKLLEQHITFIHVLGFHGAFLFSTICALCHVWRKVFHTTVQPVFI